MPAAKDFYVAIELGSSKITGIAGQKKMDGSITVLAIATEEAASCIRKGVVYNIDKTNQSIRNIIQKLQNQLQMEVAVVHVGIGGQGIRSLVNVISNDLDEATVISHSIIDTMMDSNRGTRYANQTILEVEPQEYKVDSQYQKEPVGIECNRIEGHFLNILWREAFYRNLSKCFEQQGMPRPCYYLAPMALADNILTDSERRTGCVLIDLGAGTTTVSVYFKNILRHLVTIPIGGNNVTKDIASFHIDEIEAEKMKVKYGSAYTSDSDIDPEMKLSIDTHRSIPQREFISMVEARVEEIIKNAIAQIPSEYTDKLVGGIIITGGGSKMKNMELAFRKYSNIEKVRFAQTINTSVNVAKGVNFDNGGTYCTALSLLAKSDQKSDGRTLSELTNMFNDESVANDGVFRSPDNKQPGQILTAYERQMAEEAAEKAAAEKAAAEAAEAAARKQKEEEQKRKEEEERKRNSLGSRMKRSLTAFFKSMVDEEE